MIIHKHIWVKWDGEIACEICGKTTAEIIFEEMRPQYNERYGFHCWKEDSPWQANAIKILEDLR